MNNARYPMRLPGAALAALVLVLPGLASPSALAADARPKTPNDWMSGEDPVTVNDKKRDGPADYLDLFHPDAPWASSAAAKLKGFKISTQMEDGASVVS
jgi:hypothetical protein